MMTILTGSSQGLGKELAELYASDGELVVINRTETGRGGEIVCDLSDKVAVDTAVAQLLERLGDASEVHVIMNAADYGEDITMSDVAPDMLGRLLYVNVFSQLTIVERLVKEGLDVKLIALSSGMGSVSEAPESYHYAYCASKAALNLCIRLLREQHSQLSYLIIDPGWMKTRMGGSSATQDPVKVAANIVAASANSANWNRTDGMLEANTGKIVLW